MFKVMISALTILFVEKDYHRTLESWSTGLNLKDVAGRGVLFKTIFANVMIMTNGRRARGTA